MISKALAKKIRYLQIYTSKAVNESLAGNYHSVFKGRGMEFEEVRQYQVGDDVRSIDWNVTARAGEPFIKRFVEERELTVIFLVDLSASGAFGSAGQTKNEIAAELCALLAFSAVKNNDKVGLIAFTNIIELFVPPAKGTTHVLRLIRDLLEFKPRQSQTDISAAIDYLGRITTKRAVVFLVSDFLASGYETRLHMLSKRHDIVAVSVIDPREITVPNVGLVELQDAETGDCLLVDTGSRAVRRRYEQLGAARRHALRDVFRSMSIDQVEVIGGTDYVRDLVRFFRTRERRAQKQ